MRQVRQGADRRRQPCPLFPSSIERPTAPVELYADLETEGTADVLVAAVADKTRLAQSPSRRPVAAAAPPAPRFGYNVYEAGAMGATSATGATGAAQVAPGAPTAPCRTLSSP